ncbi:hypothetical protein E2C01_045866 [Portunus trituberculatus]|uniref:Uncharacterized protein n=1 Tax=Portunus trituberculatus TaxID=210409 RepID=A0A5B7G360_PORTR|nr:hypothetical protein [Portunus trituberculatus]
MSSMRKEVVEREGEALSSRPESRFSRSSSMPAVASCWLPMAPLVPKAAAAVGFLLALSGAVAALLRHNLSELAMEGV